MFSRIDYRRAVRGVPALSLGAAFSAAALVTAVGCGKGEAPRNDSGPALAPAAAEAPSAGSSAASGGGGTPVRGTITTVTDTSLTVATATGSEQVRLVAPVHVYARAASDLAHVTPNAFVGITSMAQPDGSERATEIHIFPEALRGTGEGSRMMEQTAGGAPSTMTNGSVAPSRMTNGSVSGSRMTNGTVSTNGGTSYTIQYRGGTRTIVVPPGVTVTAIAPTETKLAVGASVVVLAAPGPDGRPTASTVMLSGPTPPK
jgi:hypothetical protein